MKIDIPDPRPLRVFEELGVMTNITEDRINFPDWDSTGWESKVPKEIRERYGYMNVWQKVVVAVMAEQLLNNSVLEYPEEE